MKGGNSAHPCGLGVGCIILIILAQNIIEYLEEVLLLVAELLKELCESWSGHPGLPVPKSPYGQLELV